MIGPPRLFQARTVRPINWVELPWAVLGIPPCHSSRTLGDHYRRQSGRLDRLETADSVNLVGLKITVTFTVGPLPQPLS